MSKAEIANMTRAELIQYLERWGFRCYDHEFTSELRTAALENHKTEGE